MRSPLFGPSQRWLRSVVLVAAMLAIGGLLTAWKYSAVREAEAASASQPEPVEAVTAAAAAEREHQQTATAIGTVLALRSITLRNEVPGTVYRANLQPGQIVAAGTVLVAFDVSVEEAELRAQEAQAELARTRLARTERMVQRRAASEMELDDARAERDVALAQISRTRAIIARKTIRAPFPARVGMADVHVGQFLEAGTELTTLQGIDEGVHVDFAVAQTVAAALRPGEHVDVLPAGDSTPIAARIVAIDARVDPETRNATVRARLAHTNRIPSPGASVRVEVPVARARTAVVVPVSALRKDPGGDHVFVLAADADGRTRAQLRRVRSGRVLGDEVVILDGLAAREQVATSGSFKLRDAVLVSVVAPPVGGSPGRTIGAR